MPQSNVESPRELLLEQLGRLLSTESLLERRVLPELVSSSDDDELKKTFAAHVEHTRKHVANIRKAFEALNAPPAGKPTPRRPAAREPSRETWWRSTCSQRTRTASRRRL
jgi:Domain of unknown function (DUF892)